VKSGLLKHEIRSMNLCKCSLMQGMIGLTLYHPVVQSISTKAYSVDKKIFIRTCAWSDPCIISQNYPPVTLVSCLKIIGANKIINVRSYEMNLPASMKVFSVSKILQYPGWTWKHIFMQKLFSSCPNPPL